MAISGPHRNYSVNTLTYNGLRDTVDGEQEHVTESVDGSKLHIPTL